MNSLATLWHEAVKIWTDGGWAMIGIAAIALVMFGVGMNLWLRLREKGHESMPEEIWRGWIARPELRRGRIGRLMDAVSGAGGVEATAAAFEDLREGEFAPLARDLKVMKVCVGAAPLVGLLGTVTGMLSTFGALASGSGGDQTMGMVAAGISEALITTETGLVIALPGLFFQYQLAQKLARYQAFLAHLESVFTQSVHRQHGRPQRLLLQSAARLRILRALARGVARPAAAPSR